MKEGSKDYDTRVVAIEEEKMYSVAARTASTA
jgi:hypothetical protein